MFVRQCPSESQFMKTPYVVCMIKKKFMYDHIFIPKKLYNFAHTGLLHQFKFKSILEFKHFNLNSEWLVIMKL